MDFRRSTLVSRAARSRAAQWPARSAGPVPRRVREAVLVLGVGLFQVGVTTAVAQRQPGAERSLDVWAIALLAAGPLALTRRRRFPVAVLEVALLAALSYWALGYPRGPVFAALLIAWIGVVVRGARVLAYGNLCAGYLGFIWIIPWITEGAFPGMSVALGVGAWLLVVAGAGEVVRLRRAAAAAEERRAREREVGLAELERRRAGEERLRIARELHDVLAHHISMMNVQASVGLELMDNQPEQARVALTAVKRASREALGELRSVLAILKGETAGEAAPREPTAGLDRLGELVARSSTGGLMVTVERSGGERPLPAAVDLAAFRIVQEALTNVVRHAAADTAVVRIRYTDSGLEISVRDNGRGVAGAGPGDVPAADGNGLHGMRQRAAALGGHCTTGPVPGRGFHVQAHLPYGSVQAGHDDVADVVR